MTPERRRILLVDDDPTVLATTGAWFEKHGWEVVRTASGEEGLGAYALTQPHVTLLDHAMPGMSGLAVLERLRHEQAVVIMLTGNGEIATAVEAMRLGAENFLQKPVDLPHLLQAVEKAAEKAALRREVTVLRRRLPSTRFRLVQGLIIGTAIAAAVIVGLLIGRGEERRTLPIPVPIEGTP